MYALPQQLMDRAFTAAEAFSRDVPRERLRRKDIVALGSGVYATKALAERSTPRGVLVLKVQALARERPDVWASHVTAAQLHELWLPPRLLDDAHIHLSQPAETMIWVRRKGVCGHRVVIRPQDVATRDGFRLSTPGRTWLEVASLCSVRELIIMGDQLVRHPYPRFEGRTEPHTTVQDLAALLDGSRGAPGRRRCLTALGWIRVGADSVQETALRLALISAGLPEPTLQVPAKPGFRWSPRADLGYPAFKLAIQYEGDTHFTPQQQRADQRRDNIFLAEGWRVLRFNAEDSREGFQRAVSQVSAALGLA